MTRTLEQRLSNLEAMAAIQQVLMTCGLALDTGDPDLFADCFTPDCRVAYRDHVTPANADIIRRRGGVVEGDSEVYQGRDRMHALATAHSRPPERYHKHVTSIPVIRVDADQAWTTSYLTLLLRHHNMPVLAAFGRYDDTFAKGDDDRWRIRERRAHLEAHAGTPPLVRKQN